MDIDTRTSSETQSLSAENDQLSDLSDEQLLQLVEETIRSNKVIESEASMFEKHLHRIDYKDMSSSTASFSLTMSSVQGSRDEQSRLIHRKRSKSRSSNLDRSLKLSAEQKCDIAQREIEELREEIDKLRADSEKVLDTYKAIMEEADVRISETKKEHYEFERDIIKGSINKRTHKVISEKVIRFFEEKLKARDTLIEKLRLRNSTLKVQKKKMYLQLKQKEEMGEVLHEVDFNQLKIENQQYLEKIDERNRDLLRLKMMAGSTLQVLNSYKKKLNTLTRELERLRSEIESRNNITRKLDAETMLVKSERTAAERINQKLRQTLEEYRVPEVMTYVQEKVELFEIQKNVKSWERKLEIAEMALKTHRKTWTQMKGRKQPSMLQAL